MKMQFDNQLSLKFPPPERKHKPVISEMVRDSQGRAATTEEDPDIVNRLKMENLILRTNFNISMERRDKQIKQLKQRIKELETPNPQKGA